MLVKSSDCLSYDDAPSFVCKPFFDSARVADRQQVSMVYDRSSRKRSFPVKIGLIQHNSPDASRINSPSETCHVDVEIHTELVIQTSSILNRYDKMNLFFSLPKRQPRISGLVWLTSIGAFLAHSSGQEPAMEQALQDAGAVVEVYKTTQDADGKQVALNMYIFKPENHQSTDRRPAIVFYFGGGWRGGKPSQFTEHCKYLASRGMVAMTADYRVSSRHGTPAVKCVSDGKSGVRWVRENADRLGVDPARIASGGGSAGGHVAACTGVIELYDDKDDNLKISSSPNAMILFNPALALAPVEGSPKVNATKMKTLKQRTGVEPKTISPVHHVQADAPPTIIFHGKADTTVPFWSAELFTKRMIAAGNQCKLIGYEGQGHGFFNSSRKNGKYKETTKEMDSFLVKIGWLTARKQ